MGWGKGEVVGYVWCGDWEERREGNLQLGCNIRQNNKEVLLIVTHKEKDN